MAQRTANAVASVAAFIPVAVSPPPTFPTSVLQQPLSPSRRKCLHPPSRDEGSMIPTLGKAGKIVTGREWPRIV